MKYRIEWHTSHFRGDHAADAVIPCESVSGETVEEMMERIMPMPEEPMLEYLADSVVIRPVKSA